MAVWRIKTPSTRRLTTIPSTSGTQTCFVPRLWTLMRNSPLCSAWTKMTKTSRSDPRPHKDSWPVLVAGSRGKERASSKLSSQMTSTLTSAEVTWVERAGRDLAGLVTPSPASRLSDIA
ncbi:unnamed protein product, partial [Ixodes pacificus]